jgi:D-beta-D-heptose 7-phosphate kinase/D-beta-D-heptose 1-phosphate adenosyltransferase
VSIPKLAPDLATLQATLAPRRAAGARVVFTNGCFDLIHPGHVRYLTAARALGDVLVVGVNGDDSVRRLKGPGRPILRLAERAEVLAGLAAVDHLIVFDEDTPRALVAALGPDVLVKGADWAEADIAGREETLARGGRVARVDLVPGVSTTEIIRRIRGH